MPVAGQLNASSLDKRAHDDGSLLGASVFSAVNYHSLSRYCSGTRLGVAIFGFGHSPSIGVVYFGCSKRKPNRNRSAETFGSTLKLEAPEFANPPKVISQPVQGWLHILFQAIPGVPN